MYGCARLVLLAALMFLAAVGVLVFFATRPGVERADLGDVAPSAQALADLRAQFATANELIDQSKRTGVSEPVSLTVTESELTSEFDDWSKKEKPFAGFRDLRVNLRSDIAILTGILEVNRLESPFRLDLRVRIESGALDLRIIRLQFGQLYVPEFLRDALVGLVQRTLDAGVPRPPIDVETLLVSEQTMVISGSTRAAR